MSKDSHSFSVSVAQQVGVPGAILMQHFLFLQKSNISGDEKWWEKWVRRSAASIANTYPYWSAKQISAIIESLEKGGLSVSKIENQNKYDRTKSYILTPKGLQVMGENAFSVSANGKAETENDIPANGKMSIKEDCTFIIPSFVEGKNAQNALTSPFSHVGTIQLPETNFSLEAEKEKAPQSSGPTPQTEILVTTHTPQAPYIRVVERVEVLDAPGPKSPGEKIRYMIEQGNYRIKETFSLRGKIPASKFEDYLTAFDTEKMSLPITPAWKNDNDLVQNFWSWSEIRYGKEQRAKLIATDSTTVQIYQKSPLDRGITY